MENLIGEKIDFSNLNDKPLCVAPFNTYSEEQAVKKNPFRGFVRGRKMNLYGFSR